MLKLENSNSTNIFVINSGEAHYYTDSAMSEILVQAFSTFYQIKKVEEHSIDLVPKTYTDPKCKRIIQELVQQLNFCLDSHDTWARYFLLMLLISQNDDPFSSSTARLSSSLSSQVQSVVKLNPAYNQNLVRIDRYINSFGAKHAELNNIKFFSNPTQSSYSLLQAYLQQASWYAAKNFFYSKIADYPIETAFPLDECFAITSQLSLKIENILSQFSFQFPNRIRTYAEHRLQGKLQDVICKRNAAFRVRLISKWGLLKQLSLKVLETSLSGGYSEESIKHFKLILQSFKCIYQYKQKNREKLPDPTELDIQQMCNRYNQLCSSLDLANINPGQITQALDKINQLARDYYEANSFSTHETVDTCETEFCGDDEMAQEARSWFMKGHSAPDYLTKYNPSDELLLIEEKEQYTWLRQVLYQSATQFLAKLHIEQQKIIVLYYGLNFSGIEIGRVLEVNQSSISRKLSVCRRILFEEILNSIKSSIQTENLSSNSNLQIGAESFSLLEDFVELLLKQYGQDTISNLWINANLHLTSDRYGGSPHYHKNHLSNSLIENFCLQVEQSLDIDLSKCDRTSKRLLEFIQRQFDSPPG